MRMMQTVRMKKLRGDMTGSNCVSGGKRVKWRKRDKTFPDLKINIGLGEFS